MRIKIKENCVLTVFIEFFPGITFCALCPILMFWLYKGPRKSQCLLIRGREAPRGDIFRRCLNIALKRKQVHTLRITTHEQTGKWPGMKPKNVLLFKKEERK